MVTALACIKRVPDTGAKIVLTDDQQDIDAGNLGYTMSPHEECAIEEAVQQVEAHGGESTVLTLGPDEATEQLRTGLAMQADDALLLESGGAEWGPRETAHAIAAEVGGDGDLEYDVLLFGNESADQENYQVGVRVARQLGIPCVTGIKDLEIDGDHAVAKREVSGGEEVYEVDLPAVITVKEGINSPRYASMRARMQARKQDVPATEPDAGSHGGSLEMVRLESPEEGDEETEVLGEGPEAAPEVVRVLQDDVEVL
ncbi:MAG: electron transfer flavoprotein subunit beta/FixA family protein [Halobacteriales archaeon]|nr:electron transfer flavoprotein subunit beta/FixA family protein [Halobacteriales archaeon]